MDFLNTEIEWGELFTQSRSKNENLIFQSAITPEMEQSIGEGAEEWDEVRKAVIETNEHMLKMLEMANQIICSQKDYIETLEKGNQEIIRTLRSIFASGEDAVIIQKEILRIIQEQNPDKDLLKDKGLDMIIQVVLTELQAYLATKGMRL